MHLWMKKVEEFYFQTFFTFLVFSQISSKILRWNLLKNFKKNRKGPPYEKWKNLKKIFLNFFHPRYSLGHPKMHIGSFFQKSLHILECLLFVAGDIWIVMPLFKRILFNDFSTTSFVFPSAFSPCMNVTPESQKVITK